MTPALSGERILPRTLGNQVIKPLATGIKRMARVKWCLRPGPDSLLPTLVCTWAKADIKNRHKEFTNQISRKGKKR